MPAMPTAVATAAAAADPSRCYSCCCCCCCSCCRSELLVPRSLVLLAVHSFYVFTSHSTFALILCHEYHSIRCNLYQDVAIHDRGGRHETPGAAEDPVGQLFDVETATGSDKAVATIQVQTKPHSFKRAKLVGCLFFVHIQSLAG